MRLFKKLKNQKEKNKLNKIYDDAPFYEKGRILFKRAYPDIKFGIGSYGLPIIKSWDKNQIVEIGKFCSIAEGVTMILGADHNIKYNTTYPFYVFIENQECYDNGKRNIVIGNDVWIGADAFIMGGVTIGDGAVIGARSIINKDVAPYSVVAGSPAKHIKYRFDDKTIEKFLKYKWWDLPIEEISSIHKLLCSENQNDLFDYLESRQN